MGNKSTQEIKENDKKYQLIQKKAGKKMEQRIERTKRKQTNNMIDLNAVISTITLHVNGVTISINRDCNIDIKHECQLHAAYKKSTLTIKI